MKKLWHDPVWSKVIATGIVGLGVYLFNLIRESTGSVAFPFSEGIGSWLKYGGGIFCVFFGLFVASKGWRNRQKKLEINRVGFLGMAGDLVISFQLIGKNIQDEPIMKINGYVRSLISGDEFPLMLVDRGVPVRLDRLQALPPESEVSLVAPFSKDLTPFITGSGPRIQFEKFLTEIGGFDLCLEIDGKTRRIRYTESKIRREFKRIKSTWRPLKPRPIIKN